MFCRNCGKQINDDVKFCLYCGAATTADQNAAADAVQDPAPAEQIPDTAPSPVPQSPAVEPVTYTAPAQPAKAKKLRPKTPAVVTVVLSCLFGLLAFSFVIYGTVGLAVRNTLSQNLISQEISRNNPADIVIGGLLTKQNVIEELEKQNIDTDMIDKDTTLAEFIMLISDQNGLTDEDVSEILENSAIMPYIGSIAEAYENYILTGESEDRKLLSTDRIWDTIEKSARYFRDNASYDVKANEDIIRKNIDSNIKNIKKAAPSETLSGIGGLTPTLLSPAVVIIALVLAAGFIVLVAVTTRNIPAALLTGGITALLNTAVMFGVGFSVNPLLNAFGITHKSIQNYIANIISPLTSKFSEMGIFCAIAGVVLIACFIIVQVVSKRAGRKEQVSSVQPQ